MLRIKEFLQHFSKKQLVSFGIAIFLVSLAILTPLIINRNQDTRSDASTGNTASTSNKNAVVFLVDDLDEESLNLMLEKGKLPNIQKYLVNAGTRFKNSFVTQSMCCPSRATLLTGKYSHNTKVFNVIGSESGMSQEVYNNNLAVWMKNAGYKTAYIGKFMNAGQFGYDKRFSGWDYWERVSGFDARPGKYTVFKNTSDSPGSETSRSEPDVYQTKYISDEAISFIDSAKSKPFLLVTAPNSVHLDWPGNWTLSNNGQPLIVDPANTRPIVAFNTFKHPNENVGIRQHAILGSGDDNYTVYYRDINQNGNTSAWTSAGSSAENFKGTISKPIISFNIYVLPGTTTVRQQLIRGTNEGTQVYYRDLPNLNWIDLGSGEKVFTGTGTAPILAFSATDLADGTTEQHLLRGSDGAPVEHYSRMGTSSNRWTTWFKEGSYWDWGTGSGKIADIDIRALDKQKIQSIIIRENKNRTGYLVHYQQLNSFYKSSDSQVLGATSQSQTGNSEFPTTRSVSIEEGEMFTKQAAETPVVQPFGSFAGRVYADGNWPNALSYQTYSPSLYPGGVLPFGTLRQSGDPQGDVPLPGYDLPGLSKASFNVANCSSSAMPGLCGIWPDVYSSVEGGKQHIDYIRRQHLDRLESLISIDVMVGEVMRKLESENLLDKTVVIFTSDNGYFSGEHRLGNKIMHYEESLRVPLLVRAPGTTGGKQNTNTVANIDLTPTILDYAGLTWDNQSYAVDGRSLKPLLTSSETLASNWRKYVLFEHRYPRNFNVAASAWNWAWAIPDHTGLRIGLEAQTTQGKDSVIIRYNDDPLTSATTDQYYEYFDLAKDGPSQILNRYDIVTKTLPGYDAGLLSSFNTNLDRLSQCSGSTCRTLDGVTQVNARVTIPSPATVPSANQKSPTKTVPKATIKFIK